MLASSSHAVVDDLSVADIEFADPYEFPTLSLSVQVQVYAIFRESGVSNNPKVVDIELLWLPPMVSAVVVESVSVMAGADTPPSINSVKGTAFSDPVPGAGVVDGTTT